MLKLSEFRTKLRGLPDLLNYAAIIDDGIILNKDGSFMAAWVYRGDDMDSASEEELGALSARVNSALCRRGSGWMIHVDAMRVPATDYPRESSFPDRTTRLMDEERRLQHQAEGLHFESRYVITLTYLPPVDAEGKLTALLIEGDKEFIGAESRDPELRAMKTFLGGVADMQDSLSSAFRSIKRLKAREVVTADGQKFVVDDFLTHLNTCVTGERHPVRLPAVGMYLDALIGTQDFYGGLKPRVAKKHIRTIAITGYPIQSSPGILDFLNRQPTSYRWSNRFIFLDPTEAEHELNKYRRRWAQKRKSFMNMIREQMGQAATHINHAADEMANDAVNAIAEVAAGSVKYGYYTAVLVLMDEDLGKIEDLSREIRKLINNSGFTARIEDVNAVEAFLGSLPGHGYPNIRRPLMHTLNLADFLPLTAVWPGLEHNPCPFYPPESPPLLFGATSGATPFRLSLHVSDTGHTLIMGPTGAGKSTLLGLIIASQMRYPRAQVFAFDKGYSAFILTKAAGGEHYDINGEHTELSFYPLAHVDKPSERIWASEWIETLITLQGMTVTIQHRAAIHNALTLLGASAPEKRTLTDLVNTVQDSGIRDALRHYTLSGALGTLLDADEDSLRDGHFQVFEMEHLMPLGEKNVVPVLLYLFHRLEQRLKGQPTLLVLDEAWLMLDNSIFKAKIREWLKTLRKANAAVIFATQSVSDVMNSSIKDVILESCPTKILLPNPEARNESSADKYKQMGLSKRQIEILSFAVPKRQYYYMSVIGRRLFDLGLGPVCLSFIGAGGKEDLARARELMEEHPSTWPALWLRQRGQSAAAERWSSYDMPSTKSEAGPQIQSLPVRSPAVLADYSRNGTNGSSTGNGSNNGSSNGNGSTNGHAQVTQAAS